MPIVLGLLIGVLVYAGIWAYIGPFVALMNFFVGRFFIASVLMAASLFGMTIIWSDFYVSREEYIALLVIGLVLEAVKWLVKWGIITWWQKKQDVNVDNIIINIVDDPPPMRDVTPRVRQIAKRT